MRRTILIALRTTAVTLALTGLAYPLVVTGLAKALFPARAGGSLVVDDRGRVVGSDLLGQRFEHPAYFHPRPSATREHPYNAAASSGSNLGPTSKKLRERALADLERLRAENPDAPGPVPGALVTASASGLDPHLPPEAALWQVPRIARARHVAPKRIQRVVEAHIEGRNLAFLGEPRVNVLRLNLALDRQFGRPPDAPVTP